MSRRDPHVRVRQMLAYARKAAVLVQGKSRADLDSDEVLSLALTRLLDVIGEAANRVPGHVQAQHLEIPWRQIIDLRNRLIHGYDVVDLDLLWQIASQDLPPLVAALEQIVPREEA